MHTGFELFFVTASREIRQYVFSEDPAQIDSRNRDLAEINV
jgi:hypothetical protein